MAARIAARESTAKSSARPKRTRPAKRRPDVPVGALIAQPHGGALRNGGTNKGGSGRPSSEVKARLRGSFYDRIAILEEIADAAVVMREKCPSCGFVAGKDAVSDREQPAYTDRLKSLDMMAKYGGDDDDVSAEEVRKRLEQTIATIRATVEPSTANVLIAALGPVWA